MTSAGADKRSRRVIATAVAALRALLLGVLALGALGGGSALATTDSGGASAPGGASSKAQARKTVTKAKQSLHVTTVRIKAVKCVPASKCGTNPHEVSQRGTLLLSGSGLQSGMYVAFPHVPRAHITRSSPGAALRQGSAGLEVTVPANAHSGNIMVLLSGERYTSSYGPITVVNHALHPPAPAAPPPAPASAAAPSASAFEGQGMWIWYLSDSDGGNLASIVAQAHAAGVSAVFVKSSDGSTNYWSQFSPELVAQLHANGLKVCAWQYVYGTNPVGEAELGARAVADGADCLVIDAEAQYEGHYAAAQTYITDLRAKIGASYPLGLASFPYVWDHPTFPYSVFLGPNGAQFNTPQMYWKDIGNSVEHGLREHVHRQPRVRPSDHAARSDVRRPVEQRPRALPRGGGRLWRDRAVVVGLAGNQGQRLDGAGGAAEPAHERDAEPRLHRTVTGRQGRPRAVDAGAPGERGPESADDGSLRKHDRREPRAVPGRARDRRDGHDRSGDLAGAAGAPAGRSGLDRRGAERLGRRRPAFGPVFPPAFA